MADLFRKNALDNMATPEQLDKQVKIISPCHWLICIMLVVGLVTFLLWSFTYKITSGIKAEGVVFINGDVVKSRASRECIVRDVIVDEGEYVDIGDAVAIVSNEEILKEIEDIREQLSDMTLQTEEYEDLHKKMEGIIDEYISGTVIKSQCSGQIQNVAYNGESLLKGDYIFSVIPDSGYKEVVTYLSMQEAKNLKLGMKAQISPVYAAREEYGYMTGTVIDIVNIPVSKEDIMEKMGTLSYVESILPDTSCVEVRIRLDLDNESQNTYNWSSKKGREVSVDLGTQCSIIIITDEYHPFELILN